MFLMLMRHETVTVPERSRIDWKGLGYLISIVSVFFLGAVAWPKPSEPWWHLPALVAGMATSIVGMACRYKAHLDQQREIRMAEAEARKN
ncbi:MAG: hypothetical protein ACJ8EH_00705 [Sphingomicrobium sp.]